MLNVKISIALATCNGETYLQQQLESLANQSLLPMELVVSDDSSSDNTVQIITEFARNAPFPTRIYLNQKRMGYSANFFYAASLCSGQYIAFCDQDDIWENDKIERVMRILLFSHRKPDIVLHTCKLLYETKCKSLDTFPPHLLDTRVYYPFGLDPFAIVPGHCIIATKELIEAASSLSSLLLPDSILQSGHDDIVYFLGACAGVTQVISMPLVSWRQHLGNTCGLPSLGLASNNDSTNSSHVELMADLSDRWKRLSYALDDLSNNINTSYSDKLKVAASLFFHRSCYYDCRKVISISTVPIWVRIYKLLNAHVRYSYASGLRLSCMSAVARDVCTLLLPISLVRFLARCKSMLL